MASLQERAGSRAMALESVLPYVDRVVVSRGDHGASAKFDCCRGMPPGSVFVGIDDDLVYPPDYVPLILKGLEQHPGSIVAHLGYTIVKYDDDHDEHPGEIRRYHNYRCLDELDRAHRVDVVGSGVCAFNIDTIRPLVPEHFPITAGDDVFLALLAEQTGVPRFVLPHPARWFSFVEWRQTMWTETVARTGSPLDASAATDRALAEIVALKQERAK